MGNAFEGCTSLTNVTFGGAIPSTGIRNSNSFPGDLRTKFYATDKTNGTAGTYTRPANGTTWTRQTQTAAVTPTPTAQYDSESDFQVTKTATAITITKYVGKKTVVNIPLRIQNLPVISIGEEAFNEYGDSDITGITIPNGVTSIGFGAFVSLFNLTSVTIPNSVTTIGQSAFQDCKSLTNVTIPNSVTSIGHRAFYRCTSLTSVTFGGTIPSSGFNADAFAAIGDLRDKFYATDKSNGTAGTYTRPNGTSTTWTKK